MNMDKMMCSSGVLVLAAMMVLLNIHMTVVGVKNQPELKDEANVGKPGIAAAAIAGDYVSTLRGLLKRQSFRNRIQRGEQNCSEKINFERVEGDAIRSMIFTSLFNGSRLMFIVRLPDFGDDDIQIVCLTRKEMSYIISTFGHKFRVVPGTKLLIQAQQQVGDELEKIENGEKMKEDVQDKIVNGNKTKSNDATEDKLELKYCSRLLKSIFSTVGLINDTATSNDNEEYPMHRVLGKMLSTFLFTFMIVGYWMLLFLALRLWFIRKRASLYGFEDRMMVKQLQVPEAGGAIRAA